MVGREPADEVDVGREWEEAGGGTWMLSGRPGLGACNTFQFYVLTLPFAFASHRMLVHIKAGDSCRSVWLISHPVPPPKESCDSTFRLTPGENAH